MNPVALNLINTFLLAFVSLALPPLFAWGLALLHKHNLNTAWYEAVGRAGGVVWATMVANGTHITDKEGLTVAAYTGAQYFQKFMAEQIAARKLTIDDVAQLAAAEYSRMSGNTAATVLPGVTAVPGPGQEATATVQPEGIKT